MSEYGNATGARSFVQETGYARKDWDRFADSEAMMDRLAAAGTAGAIIVDAVEVQVDDTDVDAVA